MRGRQQTISGFNQSQQKLLDRKAELESTLAKQKAQKKQLAEGKKKIEADLEELYDLRQKAYGWATSTASTYTGAVPDVSGTRRGGRALRLQRIGTPYVWAARPPPRLRLFRAHAGGVEGGGQEPAAQRRDAVEPVGKGQPRRAATR